MTQTFHSTYQLFLRLTFFLVPFFPQLHCFAIQMIGLHMQKQSSEVFYKKSCSSKFCNIYGKHLCWSLLKLQVSQACNFIKKRLHNSFFPVSIAKFLRTAILKSIYKRLHLYMMGEALIKSFEK